MSDKDFELLEDPGEFKVKANSWFAEINGETDTCAQLHLISTNQKVMNEIFVDQILKQRDDLKRVQDTVLLAIEHLQENMVALPVKKPKRSSGDIILNGVIILFFVAIFVLIFDHLR